MAIFKTDIMLTGISGKIGGQSLSKQTQYNTIRNISQPAKDPSPLQSTQRFITAAISAEWRTLTAGQKAAWITTAVNYTYKDPFGNTITRTPFGAFRYVGQNLWLNGLKPLRDAPTYIDVVKPIISIDSSTTTELIISGTGATSDYFYPLFVQINLNPGQKGIGRQQRHIANLSSSQLTSGIDILPIIQNYFKQPLNSNFLSFAVDTISIAGGNRAPSLDIITIDLNEPIITPTTTLISVGTWQNGGKSFIYTPNGLSNIMHRTNFDTYLKTQTTEYFTSPWTTESQFARYINWQQFCSYSPDGMKAFVWRYRNTPGIFYEYALQSPFGLKTVAAPKSFSVIPNIFYTQAQLFDNGKKLFFIHDTECMLYTLSTAYDISTATFTSTTYNLIGTIQQPIWFSPDGLKLFRLNGPTIEQYALNVPFDLVAPFSNLIYSLNLQPLISFGLGGQYLLYFSADGLYFALGTGTTATGANGIATFELSIPWELGNLI